MSSSQAQAFVEQLCSHAMIMVENRLLEQGGDPRHYESPSSEWWVLPMVYVNDTKNPQAQVSVDIVVMGDSRTDLVTPYFCPPENSVFERASHTSGRIWLKTIYDVTVDGRQGYAWMEYKLVPRQLSQVRLFVEIPPKPEDDQPSQSPINRVGVYIATEQFRLLTPKDKILVAPSREKGK